ncbi:hypothetical protein E1281_28110 [Actinomadura sp. KC345]|uniref:DUF6113 family protein n=1 Tax=Actinomadura sp. KC345 TaxID=2530371 RepID=UPI0010450E86|nr:DUF6113 family protein [Actinomadura sp. KC345]TDC46354.1 hypothetical protein E1281_28110 [Actinomadura sp. KC345]
MDEDDDESQVSLAKNGPRATGEHGSSSPGEREADGAGASPAGERPDDEAPFDAFLSGAAYAALGLLGALFGLIGSFAQSWTYGPVPVAALVLVALVFVMVRLAGMGMGGRLGATVPAVLWSLVAFLMTLRRAEGDLIVSGSLAGYVFVAGGMVAAVAGIMLVPPARPPGEWLLRKPARSRG